MKNKIDIKMNNIKGVTLTELLVSVAILAVVAAPFLSSFTAATRSNVLAETKLESSAMAQKAMDIIKTKVSGPVATLENAPEACQPSDTKYKVRYQVEEETNPWTLPVGDADIDDDNFDTNSPEVTGSALKLDIDNISGNEGDDSVKITSEGNVDAFTGLRNKKYLLEIKPSGSNYTYTLGDGSTSFTKSFSCSGDMGVRVQFAKPFKGTDKLNLRVKIDNAVSATVNFYIVDNIGNYLWLQNFGGKDFYEYDLSTAPQHVNSLFKITVVVEKNGTEVNRLISYIKK